MDEVMTEWITGLAAHANQIREDLQQSMRNTNSQSAVVSESIITFNKNNNSTLT